jgi:hypothetical protein
MPILEIKIGSEAVDSMPPNIKVGMHALTKIGKNPPEWSIIVQNKCIGVHKVAKIDLGGVNFACGVNPDKFIFTHNNQAGNVVK